jgi:hypothetical protein
MPAPRTLMLQPEQIKLLWTVFDATWAVLKDQYACSPESAEAGRLRLANAVLSAYRDGGAEVDVLKERVLRLMRAWS